MKVTSDSYHTAQMVISKIMKVLPMLVVIAGLTIGGVDALAKQGRSYIYELGIINNTTNVVTSMRVRAKSEKEAKDNVVANGWTVFSVKQLTYDVVEPSTVVINEGAGSVHSETSSDLVDKVHSSAMLSKLSKGDEFSQNASSPDDVALSSSEISYIQGVINNNRSSTYAKREPIVNKTDNKMVVHAPTSTSVTVDIGGKLTVGSGVENTSTKSEKVYHGYDLASLEYDAKGVKSRTTIDFDRDSNEAKKVVNGDKIYLDDEEVSLKAVVYFHFNADEPIADKVITSNLRELPKDKKYIVVGYSDGAPIILGGKYSNNYDLSYARAESVAKLLMLAGIKANEITLKGGGVYSQSVDEEGKKVLPSKKADPEKRRVEIYVK